MKLQNPNESAVGGAQETSRHTSPTNPVGWKGFLREEI